MREWEGLESASGRWGGVEIREHPEQGSAGSESGGGAGVCLHSKKGRTVYRARGEDQDKPGLPRIEIFP